MNLIPHNLPIVQKSEVKIIQAEQVFLQSAINEFLRTLFEIENMNYTVQDVKINEAGTKALILYYSTYQLVSSDPT